jgi:hypothetical protein
MAFASDMAASRQAMTDRGPAAEKHVQCCDVRS